MKQVLIVEDSPTQAQALSLMLSERGFESVIAESGEAALDILLEDGVGERFDTIVSDAYMPGISGYELCEIVKSRDELRQIPFVLLTARKEPMEIINGLGCGADGFLTKPAEEEYIAARLNSLIDNRRMRETGKFKMGIELSFLGKQFNITADKEQILNLLISTFEDIHHTNSELERSREELTAAKAKLEDYARQVEIRLDASLEKLRTRDRAIEALDVAVVIVHAAESEMVVEDVNPAFERITGYARDAAIGWPLGRLDGECAAAVGDLLRSENGARSGSTVVQCRRSDGSQFWNEVSISSVRNGEGAVDRIVILMRDVTERVTLETKYVHAQKMEAVGQLTGGIAHDFNNLLTVIIGNLEMLEEEIESGLDEATGTVRQAINASLRGADLTRQLLSFSRRQVLQPSVFDPNTLVADTIGLLQRSLGEHIEIVMQLEPDVWPAYCDKAQLENALANLAINARDAMPEGGRLIVETSNCRSKPGEQPAGADVEYVLLSVSDNGTGIPSDVIEKVCEPFFTTKEEGKGTGLGLSTVYGFVQQSNGHLDISSEPGQGTVIRMYLPKACSEMADNDLDGGPPIGTPAAGARVLVVEDKPDVRRNALAQLSALGYEVLEAEDAAGALSILESDPSVDVLFTDVVLPGGTSGTELALRVLQRFPDARVLLTSGFAGADADCASLRGCPLLRKPYRREELGRAIRDTLARRLPERAGVTFE